MERELSGDLKADYNDDNGSIAFDKPIEALTSGEMIALLELYIDGCCPVCLAEIPLNGVICDGCFDRAKAARA